MKLNVSESVRLVLYVVTSVGGFLCTYALAKGWIGTDEVTLWGALSGFVAALAAFNVYRGGDAPVVASEPVVERSEPTVDPDSLDWVNPNK